MQPNKSANKIQSNEYGNKMQPQESLTKKIKAFLGFYQIGEFIIRYWGLTLFMMLFVVVCILPGVLNYCVQILSMVLGRNLAVCILSPAHVFSVYFVIYFGFVYGKKVAKKSTLFQRIEPIFSMIILALLGLLIAICIWNYPAQTVSTEHSTESLIGNGSGLSVMLGGGIGNIIFICVVFLTCIAIGVYMATLKYPHPGFDKEHPLIINGRIYAQHVTGVQRYGIEIIRQIDKLVEPGEVILALPHGELLNKAELEKLENIELAYIGKGNGNKWTQFHLPIFAFKKKGTILTLAAVAPAIKPDYVATHDISFMRYPESYGKRFRIMYAIGYFLTLYRCKGIITISEFSKNELINFYGLDEDRFTIAGNSAEQLLEGVMKTESEQGGCPFEKQKLAKALSKEHPLSKWGLSSEEPYYLSVGSMNLHKNQVFIKKLAQKYPDKKFVVAGGSSQRSFGASGNMDKEDGSGQTPENLVCTGYITDDEVRTLYVNAYGFIFPSLYEGFGIPPLEAILMGVKHVAVSDIPVLREVYPKGCYFFDPNDASSFDFEEFDRGEAIITEEIRDFYIKKYSWKKSAGKILETIRRK